MRVLRVTALAVVLIGTSACGGGDEAVVTQPAAGGEGEDIKKTEVEEAYLDYWEIVTRLETGGPTQDAEIATRATGPALVKLSSELALLEIADQVNQHGDAYEHRVMSVDLGESGADTTRATLRDCFVNDATVIDRATNDPLADQKGVVTTVLAATLVVRDGWQLQSIEVVDTFDGVAPESCS
jgi:hypothetical protein